MKVLLTSDNNPESVNGVIVSVMNLKRELELLGANVKLLTLSSSHHSKKEGNIYYVGSIPFNVYPDVRASVNSYSSLIEELIEWKPDIIHSQCEFFTYSFVRRIARKCGCPIVHTYHTMYEHYIRYLLPVGNWGRLVAPIMRFRLRTSDVIIAPTKKVRDSLLAGHVTEEIRIIPTGIDLSKYEKKLAEKERRALLRALSLPENAKIFGSVGRLAEEKNYTEVLQALHELLKTDDSIYLILVGDGAYREALIQQMEDLQLKEHVRLTGMIQAEELYRYYQLFSFFISASVSETQGLTYIEALANGTPVIAREDGAIQDVVVTNVNGYQYTTLEDLISVIRRAFSDAAWLESLHKGAWECRERFGTALFGSRIYKLYKEVLNRDNPPRLQDQKLKNQIETAIKIRVDSSDYAKFYRTIQSGIIRKRWERKKRELEKEEDQNNDRERYQ